MIRRIITAAIILFMLALMAVSSVYAEGERATFDVGTTVRSTWISLAGGQNNVKEIRQYTGDAVPEGVTTRTVSSSDSETPIYSWFEDGVIYYWSEDPKPYTNGDASYMFYSFSEAVFIDAKPFDTSKTTDMEAMFADLGSLKKLDVSGFDTSNVKCMYCMFIYDSALEELDVSRFNTSNATSLSDQNYGSLCGMFLGCSSLKMLDLSSFDMTRTSWTYTTQNMFPGCTSLEKLILGPNVRFNSYTALSGSWTHIEDGLTLSGAQLTSGYNAANSLAYSGTWMRNMPEGHYYRTDGSLGETNMWEVHSPDDRFKGYCLNLNRFGVGEELDRVLAGDDSDIIKLLCTEEQGSVHGSAPIGATMREALIALIYYGWPNDAAGIQDRYGLTDQEYLEVTQNAIWDFTDRYDEPAGPSLYEGSMLSAYNDLVSQRFVNIEKEYMLFLYESRDTSKQNLLSIMGVDDQIYGGVCIRKQNADGSENLAGAEFTIYDEEGNEVDTIVTGVNGTAYACRTDHSEGLPLGKYTVRETKPPAGYELSDWEYHFEIEEANVIVTDGWRKQGEDTIEEEMIYFDGRDEDYQGGGIAIIKQSDKGKKLVGAEFDIIDAEGNVVKSLVTNDAGVAMTGKQDLPLGTYTVVETRTPEGHKPPDPESQTVEITENMQMLTLTFTDEEKKGSVTLQAKKILDLEIPDGELEEGQFTFQLLDAKGNVLQEKSNNADGDVVFDTIEYTPDDLGYANYRIREVIGDTSEFRYDRHEENVTVTIYDDHVSDELLCTAIYDSDGAEFTNRAAGKKYSVSFMKKKLNSNKQLNGAVIEILDQAGRLIESWVSAGEPHVIELEPGKYTVREKAAPQGYNRRSDIKIEIDEEGSLISSDEEACDEENREVNIYDSTVSSTGLQFRKVDSGTKSPLEDAEFTLERNRGEESDEESNEEDYFKTETSGTDGIVKFDDVTTGTYTLTETKAPYGYSADGSPWTVDVVVNKVISKTANIATDGTASGEYSSQGFVDTVTIPGNPEKIHVNLRYQTEDDYDYLLLKDKEGNVITEDAGGNPIGDTRDAYKGRIWGGMNAGKITDLTFDLPGDTVVFDFHPDENTAAYGYYAVVTTDPLITVKDSEGKEVSPDENGIYDLPNRQEEIEAAKADIKVRKLLEGRGWQAGDSFTFMLSADDETFPLPDVTELTVRDGNEASFGEMTFDTEGIYTYKVKEQKGSLEGVTYDETDHIVTIRVEDKDKDLVLDAEVTYEGSQSGTAAEITNRYEDQGGDDGPDDGGDDGPDDGGDDGPDDGGDDGPDDGGDDGPDDGGDDGPDDGGDDGPDDGGDDGPDDSGDDNPDDGGDDNPDDSGDDNPDDGGDDNPDDGQDEVPDDSQDESTDDGEDGQDEEEKPEAGTSARRTPTGDDQNLTLWLILAAVSGLGLAGAVTRKRRY